MLFFGNNNVCYVALGQCDGTVFGDLTALHDVGKRFAEPKFLSLTLLGVGSGLMDHLVRLNHRWTAWQGPSALGMSIALVINFGSTRYGGSVKAVDQ